MRYIGSKRKIGRYILPFINWALARNPKGIYIEPFVGGANMITQVKHHTRIGYDLNEHLVALLKQAQSDPESLKAIKCPSQEDFKYVKDHRSEFYPWYVGAVGYFPTYCNKWMESYTAHYWPKHFEGSKNNLLQQDLSGIHLRHGDYRYIPTGTGNVIYCDPPYQHFDFYKMRYEHEEFCNWVRDQSSRNIVFVSEYQMPSDFKCVWSMPIKPGINHKATTREEKLFIYQP